MSHPRASVRCHTASRSASVTGDTGAAQRLDAPPDTRKSVTWASPGVSRNSTSRRPASALPGPGTGCSPTTTTSFGPLSISMSPATNPLAKDRSGRRGHLWCGLTHRHEIDRAARRGEVGDVCTHELLEVQSPAPRLGDGDRVAG